MRRRYKRYDWNLFGKQCGINIIGRLDWINGKPMVYVTLLNVFLIVVNKMAVDIPELSEMILMDGWCVFQLVAAIAFWVLFVDGVIVRFLWSFTRGEYFCPYLVRLIKLPKLDNRKDVKEELSWAHFLFKHPEFDYKLQEIKQRYNNKKAEKFLAGESISYMDEYDYECEFESLVKEYGVRKDGKGRYFTWHDKKYRKILVKMFRES